MFTLKKEICNVQSKLRQLNLLENYNRFNSNCILIKFFIQICSENLTCHDELYQIRSRFNCHVQNPVVLIKNGLKSTQNNEIRRKQWNPLKIMKSIKKSNDLVIFNTFIKIGLKAIKNGQKSIICYMKSDEFNQKLIEI